MPSLRMLLNSLYSSGYSANMRVRKRRKVKKRNEKHSSTRSGRKLEVRKQTREAVSSKSQTADAVRLIGRKKDAGRKEREEDRSLHIIITLKVCHVTREEAGASVVVLFSFS